jgi:type IV pilus assembly protein PilM
MNILRAIFPKKMVGVDIGTASIKIVEVSDWGGIKTLDNYGEAKSDFIFKMPSSGGKTSIPTAIDNNLASLAIKKILVEAGIKSKTAIFSVPDFYTFCTSFEIPPMPEKEISEAIRYNASQYITLPISEVSLDWKTMSNSSAGGGPLTKVFIVAIPKQIIEDYRTIAKGAGLDLVAVEAEVFGLVRPLIDGRVSWQPGRKTICLTDIGAQSSTINIVDQGFLKRSYSSDFGGIGLTNAISSVLNNGYSESEIIKKKEGINSLKPAVVNALSPLINSFLTEIKDISSDFFQSDKKQVESIWLTGGAAVMPGLMDYFAKNTQKQISILDCFLNLKRPSIINETLKEIAPRFSVATGVALDGLEI